MPALRPIQQQTDFASYSTFLTRLLPFLKRELKEKFNLYIASLTVIPRGSWVGQFKWAFQLYVGCTSKDLFNPSLLPKPIPKLFHMNGLTVWYLMLWIKPYSMLFQGTKIFWVFHFLKGSQEQTFCPPPHICCFLTPSPLPLSLFIFGCKLRIHFFFSIRNQG